MASGLPEQARDALIRAGREAMAYERTKVSQMLVADDRACRSRAWNCSAWWRISPSGPASGGLVLKML